MINNYIRGGQIFLHKLRMIKQVWDKTLLIASIVSILLSTFLTYDKFLHLDFYSGLTYLKAIIVSPLDRIFPNSSPVKISAMNNMGVYSKNIDAKEILKHQGFKRRYDLIISTFLSSLILGLWIMLGFSVIIIFVWTKFGKASSSKDIIKGGSILSAVEVSKILKKQFMASDFVIGKMPLVKNSETSHILITGTTGSGKTSCMNEIMPQIRSYNHPAIIVDYTGQMTKKYYDESRGDAIITNNEAGAHIWDFWEDIKDEDNLAIIANSLFTDRGSGYDEMWNNASKQFFKDSARHIAKNNTPKISDLYRLLSIMTLSEVHEALKGSVSASMLDPNNEKTAMSVRTNTIAFIDWMENFREGQRKLSLSNWFSEKKLERGSWLFFKSTPKQRTKLRNFYSMLLDLCINQIMELGQDYDRRIWMVIDELPSLKKLPSLAQALSEFRKYGGCIMASMQSPHQLFELYGQNNAYAMLDQFNTKFIFRTDEHNFASYICKGFGDIEYKEQQENYSYGSHEVRDGVHISSIERKKPLLTPDDLASLANLEAYVKLPIANVRVAKITVGF